MLIDPRPYLPIQFIYVPIHPLYLLLLFLQPLLHRVEHFSSQFRLSQCFLSILKQPSLRDVKLSSELVADRDQSVPLLLESLAFVLSCPQLSLQVVDSTLLVYDFLLHCLELLALVLVHEFLFFCEILSQITFLNLQHNSLHVILHVFD